MMNSKTKISLHFLSAITVVAEILFAISGVLLIIGAGMLAIPSFREQANIEATFNGEAIAINNSLSGITFILISLLFALLLIGTLFFIMRALKFIITNMKHMEFFSTNNLYYAKQILMGIWFIIAQQIFATMLPWFSSFNGNSDEITFDLTYLLISFIFLAIFYTIYTLLKNGIELKNENDSFV